MTSIYFSITLRSPESNGGERGVLGAQFNQQILVAMFFQCYGAGD